jgi:tetratricopeptide (TPR) repeat protein
MSSGIPGASSLSERWAKELFDLQRSGSESFDTWVERVKLGYDKGHPSASYSELMRRLFPTEVERQQEIERIVAQQDPGFGYATLAQLLADKEHGPLCNVVLTTNFDDLVADALYLFTERHPLVVTHEALADFVALGGLRPTIVKLHGDAMLAPKNTEEELRTMPEPIAVAFGRLLDSRGLIFSGYGGHDAGVLDALRRLPPEALTLGVFWISSSIPEGPFGDWLRDVDAFHVKHRDFDELMAVIKVEFAIANPTPERFDALMKRYQDTFAELQAKVERSPSTPAVSDAVERVSKGFPGWFGVELEAQKHKTSDPDEAERIYEVGSNLYPKSAELAGSYANFLSEIRQEYDRAEQLFERALELDPANAANASNYANFLYVIRDDFDGAQKLFERALGLDPTNAHITGSYANFLKNVRHAYDRA